MPPSALLVVLLQITCAAAFASSYEAPLDERKPLKDGKNAVTFTTPVKVQGSGDKSKISFTVSAATDVEVAIVDGTGRVVRHLAAGLLGKNAPEPFKRASLSQEIAWDGLDDAGKKASGSLKVRVRAGNTPKLDKILGWSGQSFGGQVEAITVGDKGEAYVLVTDHYRGRAELRVLDKEGKYLRTIMPYAADTPKERTESVGHVIVDGERLPYVFNGQGHNLYPLTSGLRAQTMAWHPKGFLIAASAVGSMCEQGPPRHLIAFDSHGGAPAGVPFVGPKFKEPIGFIGGSGDGLSWGRDRIALSPDGQYVYFIQDYTGWTFDGIRKHGVYRMKWTDPTCGPLWLGKDAAGAGDDEFNTPLGVAVDKKGLVYVADHGNNRVKIYSPEGKLVGKFTAPAPWQLAVHAKTGDIFMSSEHNLLWYSPWDGKTSKQIASLPIKEFAVMGLDPQSTPIRLWTAGNNGWNQPMRIEQVLADNGTLTLGANLNRNDGVSYPSFIAADPGHKRVIVKELLLDLYWAIDTESGKLSQIGLPGGSADIATDHDGNIYAMGPWSDHCRSYMVRVTPDGQPLPFPGIGSNRIELRFMAIGPGMGLPGHCVAPNGDIYVMRQTGHGWGSTVDIYGQDGKLKKADIVGGLGDGSCGMGVDNRGNVYVGANVKPADKPLPNDFAGKVPKENWTWWGGGERPIPARYMFINPYLWFMGSVFKFGPEGGKFYNDHEPGREASKGDWEYATANTSLSDAPGTAETLKSAYLGRDVKVAGALWRYQGIGAIPATWDGVVPDPGCKCLMSQLDVDPYGRVYAPSVFRFSVEMMDSAGNKLAGIGKYGNVDSPSSEIAFAWPAICDYSELDGKLYVSDEVNRRIMVVRFEAAAESTAGAR